MEQTPSWDAKISSSSQEIPHILWNPKVHHRAHNSPPLGSTLRPMIPAHTLPSYFLRSISILFFHLHVGIWKGFFTFTSVFPTKTR